VVPRGSADHRCLPDPRHDPRHRKKRATMASESDLTEQARLTREAHVEGCRSCKTNNKPCQAAKLLRREYNNLVRSTRR
jgi:hypothetical protein